jgi:hypothetical protein
MLVAASVQDAYAAGAFTQQLCYIKCRIQRLKKVPCSVQPVAVAHPSHQDDICAVPALSPFTFETTTNHARLAGTV